ncbi:hypothetical protein JG688_00005516 [Phytophthora aleatoria]|uniref:Uncharacterized protein n=1 Tax=Phytophthora aleatoria TaxID=2496075 RepID=A0A8J5M6H5_9STRA|nr:hypothetical protein JG688_00005516 [Phytophthora aleatoria]
MVAVQGKFVCSDNVPFGVAWEFKKQGWTRPRARDLEHKWKYMESQRRQGRGLLSQGGQIAGLIHYRRLRPRVLSSTKTSCYCGDDASGVDPRASCRVTYLDPASSSGPPQPTVRKSPAKQPRKPQRPEAKGKRRRSSRVKSSSDGEELLKPPVMTQTPMK